MTEFYVGSGSLSWLATAGVPLFFAYPAVMKARKVPEALAPWALDSGGFNELVKNGGWSFTEEEYVEGVRHLQTAGLLTFVCPMDWPCGPPALAATGKSVREHQELTVENWLRLAELAPDLPWAPVVQGWDLPDYHAHVEMYFDAGVNLSKFARVTVGSVAARQGDPVAGAVFRTLHAEHGLVMHGLGVKGAGLALYSEHLASADSRAWTLEARFKRERLCDDPDATHSTCSSCQRWAVMWRERMVGIIADRKEELEQQSSLFQVDDSFNPANTVAHRRKTVDPLNAAQQRDMAAVEPETVHAAGGTELPSVVPSFLDPVDDDD